VAEQLLPSTLEDGVRTFLLATGHQPTLQRFAAEVIPALRAATTAERGQPIARHELEGLTSPHVPPRLFLNQHGSNASDRHEPHSPHPPSHWRPGWAGRLDAGQEAEDPDLADLRATSPAPRPGCWRLPALRT
jgi:hypothetical protein